uniref:uncharacterized protein LOC117602987 isoform X1 n=1 Tax=Osmia lignaria TaxID=473952 RepID=UPI00147944A5|nr:uncharacterized protein LOC117602987 isoform X1 [Osmia lignaria]XP_034177523.1 uncharacterized protein LOC117602987 isoform X1 [Osmia lignaria]
MSVSGYVIGPQIPQGLAVVVEGLAREILRNQPADIYAFAAHHFEELLKLREKGRLVEIVPQVFNDKSSNKRDRDDRFKPGRLSITADSFLFLSFVLKVSALLDETATVRKLTAPCLTRKLARKQRETTNGCGWSINRTVKVFKKHGYKRDDKNKEEERKISDDYPEIRSAGFSKKTIRGRFVRSSSVGDLLGKHIRTEVGEETDNIRDRFASKQREYQKRLKRQKSAGQIERSEQFGRTEKDNGYAIDRERSKSVANDRAKWNESDVEERTRWYRARTGSEEGTFGRCRNEREQRKSKSAGSQRRERKKLEEKFRDAEETKMKIFKLRSEKNREESKDNRVTEKEVEEGGGEGKNLLSRIDALESLVTLPSVVTRQCSSRCSTIEVQESDEPADQSSFVLPPISNDSAKLLKKESSLTLPSLSNGRTTNTSVSGDRRDSNIRNGEEIRIADDRKDEQVNDIVSRKNSWFNENNENNENQEEDETTRVLKEIENIGYSNSRETDVEEVFKDSLNVTPDSIELSPRPDSLEHLQEVDASKVVEGDEETDRQERENDEEGENGENQEQQNRSNELKQKLLEIEMVEKSIENTLSSETAVTSDNLLEKGFLVESQVDSNRETCESDTIFITETRKVEEEEEKEVNSKKESTGDDKDNGKDDHEIDTCKGETVTGKNSNASSNISSAKDVDTDRSDVSEPVPVPLSLSLSENSLIKIDPSCYILTEGSPCEIPESVTTVIIPEKNFPNDEIVELASDPCFENTDSPWNPDEEKFQRDKNPFGDRVSPEAFQCSTSIDGDFLLGISNAVDRTAACQDLGNIKEEEEESERDHGQRDVSCVKLSEDVTSSTSDNLEKRFETIEDKNDSDCAVEGVNGGVKSENEKCLKEDEESRPYVPELNLDSLRDVTISSFATSGSKDVEDPWIKEKINEEKNEDVSFCEGENTLSSFDTLPSEEKTMLDEGVLPSKIELLREEISVDRKNEQRDDERIDDLLVPPKQGDDSSDTEEEIARELIKNLILEMPVVQEVTGIDTNDEPEETDVDKVKKEETEEEEEREDNEDEKNIVKCYSTTPTATIGTEMCLPQQGFQSGSGLWHTGEFHDSLPLPILEAPNVVSSKNFQTANVTQKTTRTTDPWFAVEPDRIGHQGFTVDPDTGIRLVAESPTQRPTVVYAIETKLPFITPSFSFLPCLVRVGSVVDDPRNANISVVSPTENTRDLDIDDLVREPLALDDDEPKPSIVIEEILVDDEKEEQTSHDNEGQ